jgi:hypothetical protein
MSRTHRALAVLALSLAVVTATTAVAAAAPPVEDQNDRLLRNLEAAQAGRSQDAAVLAQRKALYQSELAHNLAVARTVGAPIQPAAPTVPGPGVGVLAALLLGLVGGLVGGGAVIGGWIVASRRRVQRAAAAI